MDNMRLVITLNSGKSIVCTLKSEEIFKIEKKFRVFLETDDEVNGSDRILNIIKEQNGKIYEIVTINMFDISAIQVEDFYKK